MGLAYPSLTGQMNFAPLALAPIIVPVGIVITLPLTIVPTLLIGALLSAAKQTRLLGQTWVRVLAGGITGASVGYVMLLPSIDALGSAVPGLLMGSAISATWPFFDRTAFAKLD